MHNNNIWRAFLGFVFLTTLWFVAVASFRLYQYENLNRQIHTTTISWDINKKQEDLYTLTANYTYKINNKLYAGKTEFSSDFYRNNWAAEEMIKDFSKSPWLIWYDKQSPDHSSLEKRFPFKEFFSALAIFCLLLYFMWIGFYVVKKT